MATYFTNPARPNMMFEDGQGLPTVIKHKNEAIKINIDIADHQEVADEAESISSVSSSGSTGPTIGTITTSGTVITVPISGSGSGIVLLTIKMDGTAVIVVQFRVIDRSIGDVAYYRALH